MRISISLAFFTTDRNCYVTNAESHLRNSLVRSPTMHEPTTRKAWLVARVRARHCKSWMMKIRGGDGFVFLVNKESVGRTPGQDI